ncbi:MAG: recombinase RecT, partial [Alsobacter sp.]
PYTGIATYRSYVQTKKDGQPNQMWARFADTMTAKCAEALALRKGFPELSGVFTPEEMDQADTRRVELDAIDADVTSPVADFDVEARVKALSSAETPERLRAIGEMLVDAPKAYKGRLQAAYRDRARELREAAMVAAPLREREPGEEG